MDAELIFDAEDENELSNWTIINDEVMGGQSESRFSFNSHGIVIFKGDISLENNGGFASLRYRPERISVKGQTGRQPLLRILL